jgi:hypothetical protein
MRVGVIGGALVFAVLLGAPHTASAGNTDRLDAAKDLAGKTLSGVAYLPQATPQPGADETPSLKTVMFQAYLAPDGNAQVRAWDPVANRYSTTDTRPWRGEGDTLCLTVPAFALPDALCVSLHAWGPEFAGTGVNHNAMVKGDIQLGAALH